MVAVIKGETFMAYKERKLTKDEARAFYGGLNAGFDKGLGLKKKSTGGAKKKSATASKAKKK